MEVMLPSSPVMEFDFNSARSSPVSTAPSTPRRMGDCFFSAPTSPARLFEFYREFDLYDMESSMRSSRLAIPFDWDEKTGTNKSPRSTMTGVAADEGDDFAFDFSVNLENTSRSAEELFDGGKIKPLKPPSRLKVDVSSPKPPKSSFSQGKKIIHEAFSPRKKKDDRDPLPTAIGTSRNNREHGRGRERVQDFTLRNSSRRATRSLSPYRVSDNRWEDDEEEEERKQQREPTTTKQSSSSLNSKPSFSSTSSKGCSRKWRLRDLLLFRSASEGRASDKDPLRKYSSSFVKKPEEKKNSGGSRRKVSAHELHYTTNKAISENMKKKTFLPYKHGILGRLAFNSNGFGK
ncbi:Acylamino-acid-releasing enzyme, putative isoform 1 [Hibiscus syriacus]|uniref:Acylamino-acid-releasing enzyme, putative isoform 1 n=1 Tax=Hibiscus syriacus TaxID=106335 RepID=A0A6A2Y4G8_HIBSY|nr:uncharacterized protein LOC120182404 [Hibiscus syriacus]KAE8665177.1 Acylamino-acid-releasing enzyme, putative isoform 1 [Hibiscus syriacus]